MRRAAVTAAVVGAAATVGRAARCRRRRWRCGAVAAAVAGGSGGGAEAAAGRGAAFRWCAVALWDSARDAALRPSCGAVRHQDGVPTACGWRSVQARALRVSPAYVLEAPRYFVEHLLPLFVALPGWLVLLRGGEHSAAAARLAHDVLGIPSDVFLWVDPGCVELFDGNSTLLLACTEPATPPEMLARWRAHPRAVTLAHGVDAASYAMACLGNASAPERWRDLRQTHVLRRLLQRVRRRSGQPPVSALWDAGRRRVLYISTVGDFGFLDRTRRRC